MLEVLGVLVKPKSLQPGGDVCKQGIGGDVLRDVVGGGGGGGRSSGRGGRGGHGVEAAVAGAGGASASAGAGGTGLVLVVQRSALLFGQQRGGRGGAVACVQHVAQTAATLAVAMSRVELAGEHGAMVR